MEKFPKVAIIYLAYNSEKYLDDVVLALQKLNYPKEKIEFVVVDNPHPEFGLSQKSVEEKLLPKSGKEIPRVTYLPQEKNLGFAGGINKGLKWAMANNFAYAYLHNDDAYVGENAILPLVEELEKDNKIALAQSLIMLHPKTNLVNNAGNCFHYLGFGYSDEYKTDKEKISKKVKEVGYISGAACMIRVPLLEKYGLLDEDFFMYHEDMDWTLRYRTQGYKSILVPESTFYHKYNFSRSIGKYYYMERNRFAVMLLYYKIPTIILLLPILILLEVGLLFFAYKGGWFPKKIAVYKYWLNTNNLKTWLAKRKKIQKERLITDRDLLKYSVSGIHFQDEEVEKPALKYIANPVMRLYHLAVVKLLIWW